eukprot:14684724-Alexandrium_andersonii.AAC.2
MVEASSRPRTSVARKAASCAMARAASWAEKERMASQKARGASSPPPSRARRKAGSTWGAGSAGAKGEPPM